MKVLVVHNRYVATTPSGENDVVDEEIRQLRGQGVDVIPYLRSSDEITQFGRLQKAELPLRPIWSREDTAAVAELIQRTRPDVLHLHNPNPLISMGVVRVARQRGLPVVRTVHNHRHSCLNGFFYRDGHECHDCEGRVFAHPGIQHACYRGSRPQSTIAATALALHRGTYRSINRHIALTAAIADGVVAAGIPRERVVVKPNSVPDHGIASGSGFGLLFVGRLSAEKGVQELLEAWGRRQRTGHLTLVGDGPLRAQVEAVAAARKDVTYLGRVTKSEVTMRMHEARAIVVPSRWPEALPLVVLEAFAAGRPVLATDVGGMRTVVTPDVGWVVDPQPAALARAIDEALEDVTRGQAARQLYEASYSPPVVLRQLLGIYADVVGTDVVRSFDRSS